MSHKKLPMPFPKNSLQNALSDMVGFGPEKAPVQASSENPTERLKQLLRKIEDLNKRVDRLSARY